MSGKKVAVSANKAQTAVSASVRCGVNKTDASARWAALDSRHERLVTASDAILADVDRKDDRRRAS